MCFNKIYRGFSGFLALHLVPFLLETPSEQPVGEGEEPVLYPKGTEGEEMEPVFEMPSKPVGYYTLFPG